VLWDAPDCDSVDASRYLDGLVEAVTLADVGAPGVTDLIPSTA